LALLSAIGQGINAREDVSTLISAADRLKEQGEDGLQTCFYPREEEILFLQGSSDGGLEKLRTVADKYRELRDDKRLAVTTGYIARIHYRQSSTDLMERSHELSKQSQFLEADELNLDFPAVGGK
jgi:hypothetical protein